MWCVCAGRFVGIVLKYFQSNFAWQLVTSTVMPERQYRRVLLHELKWVGVGIKVGVSGGLPELFPVAQLAAHTEVGGESHKPLIVRTVSLRFSDLFHYFEGSSVVSTVEVRRLHPQKIAGSIKKVPVIFVNHSIKSKPTLNIVILESFEQQLDLYRSLCRVIDGKFNVSGLVDLGVYCSISE